MLATARLTLTPVSGRDLPDLIRLKADPLVYGLMLGGIRGTLQVIEELAAEIAEWGARGVGMFTVRERGVLQGVTGIQDRPDGRGLALRFAMVPDARGRGVAREAAAAALRFGHEQAGLRRIIAVARSENFGSRMVLGAIGMTECDAFLRAGQIVLVFESSTADTFEREEALSTRLRGERLSNHGRRP